MIELISSEKLLPLVVSKEMFVPTENLDEIPMTGKECDKVMNIIEIHPPHIPPKEIPQNLLAQVTPENADAVIAKGIAYIIDTKRQVSPEVYLPDGKRLDGGQLAHFPSEILEDVHKGLSAPHLILCSVNGIISFTSLDEYLDSLQTFRSEKKDSISEATNIIARHDVLNKTMVFMLSLELKKKLAFEKNEPAFYEQAKAQFPALVKRVQQAVNDFKEQISEHEESVSPNMLERMKKIIDTLEQMTIADFSLNPQDKDRFYTVFCEAFGSLILYDYEEFFLPRMEELMDDLEIG